MNKCFIVFALLLFTGCKGNSPFNVGDCLVHDGASLLSRHTTLVLRVKEVGGIHRDEFTLSYRRWYAWDYLPQLKMACFNPVVADWSVQHRNEEVKQRAECDFLLYVISPLMSGVYSIAEAVDDSNKHPSKTVFCVLPTDENKEGERFLFSVAQIKSLSAVGTMIKANGGTWLVEFSEIAPFLNSQI